MTTTTAQMPNGCGNGDVNMVRNDNGKGNATASPVSSWKDIATTVPVNEASSDAVPNKNKTTTAGHTTTGSKNGNGTVKGIVLPPSVTRTADTKGHLQTPWTLYYHNPESKDWTIRSYTKVHTVHTVTEFCQLCYWIDQNILHLHAGMFFLMRGTIMPTWEDPHNRTGGCWSFKVPMHEVGSLWNQLSARLVGERLSTTPMLLNGISLSPKRGFCIIKIWNHRSNENRSSLLRIQDMAKLQSGGEPLYTAFREKK